jgi:hypothetical protein
VEVCPGLCVIQLLDHLLSIRKALQRSVFQGDQHVGDGTVIEGIGCLGHLQLPGGIRTHAFERQ